MARRLVFTSISKRPTDLEGISVQTQTTCEIWGAEPNFRCLGGERCAKLREVNVFFWRRLQIIQPRLSRSHLGRAPRTHVTVRTDRHRNPRSKPPFETQNPQSWAAPCEAIPFSKTRWLTLDEYCTPERPWLKVKMRPDGIYVTESEGGIGVASHWPWSNKGQGEKIAGCETEPSRSQQVAELWLQPQIQFCSWGLKVDGGSFLPRKS